MEFFNFNIIVICCVNLNGLFLHCSTVKLWSTGTEHSVSCIEAKANVCCVKFNPESRYHLAFGSAGKF